jgi:hypothetical protein
MIPRCAAREIPDTIEIGTASSSGHGVATTRTDRALVASPAAQATPATTSVIGTKTAA